MTVTLSANSMLCQYRTSDRTLRSLRANPAQVAKIFPIKASALLSLSAKSSCDLTRKKIRQTPTDSAIISSPSTE